MGKKLIAVILCFILLFSNGVMVFSEDNDLVTYSNNNFSDISNHWAENVIQKWVGLGLVNGYPDGTFKPDNGITRAEFIKMINKIIGYSEKSEINFKDVNLSDWYADEIAKAIAAGYVNGYDDNTVRPNNEISRQEAMSILYRVFELDTVDASINDLTFTDKNNIADYAKDAVKAIVVNGYSKGYPDGSFKPEKTMTRAEAIKLLDSIVGKLFFQQGVYSNETIEGNTVINTDDIMLNNIVIKGNLYLTAGIGDGDVALENVNVSGITYVNGGGYDSININNSTLELVRVNKNSGKVRLVASENTAISKVTLFSSVKLEEKDINGDGFKNVEVSENINNNGELDLIGSFDNLELNGKVKISLDKDGVIEKLTINEKAEGVVINTQGDIKNVVVKASKVKINDKNILKGDSIIVSNGKVIDEKDDKANNNKGSNNSNWKLVWHDEFSGTEIDKGKWTFDIGNGFYAEDGTFISGWGNEELEYYKEENAYIENGKLIIEAKVEETSDDTGNYEFTSAKLKTDGLFSKKYGKFEIRAKLPKGQGLWPAIWLLPQDNVYGGWAASGEIDIMEAAGSNPYAIGGAIHYGGEWPNNVFSAKKYEFKDGEEITDFHVYGLEWEPGEIRFYVDGYNYYTVNDWYSKGQNTAANYTYPAPFDQEFYLILNLAVGGWYDGNPEDYSIFPAKMEVDYVRVYELVGKDYREAVEPEYRPEELPQGGKKPLEDGNLVYNNNYDGTGIENVNIDELYEGIYTDGIEGIENSDFWYFLTGENEGQTFGGQGTISIDSTISDNNFAKIEISDVGSQNYSVQLIQDVSLAKGNYYKLSFDAKASDTRDITIKIGGDDAHGWKAYSTESFSLENEIKSYEFIFQMLDDTDLDARLEFNLGLYDETVWIGNIRLETTEPLEEDENSEKEPLRDGNHIYNGTFDQGDSTRMTYWNFIVDGADAKGTVDEETRELKVEIIDGGTDTSSIQLSQKGLKLTKLCEYEVAFDARAEEIRNIEVEVVNEDGSVNYSDTQVISLTKHMETYTFSFIMPEITDTRGQLRFLIGDSEYDVYIDNVSMIKTSENIDYALVDLYPLENGNFENGLENWEVFIASDYGIDNTQADVYSENGAANIFVENAGVNTWSIQLYQSDLDFTKGVTYEVSFDAQSTVDRPVEITIENSSYYRYFSETVDLSNDMKTYNFEFVMEEDDIVSLKFLLGNVNGATEKGEHTIIIDNVVCQVKNADQIAEEIEGNLIINGTYEDGDNGWVTYIADWAGASGVIAVENEQMKAVVDNEGSEFWHIQVAQGNFTVEEGRTYLLSFDAMSTVMRDVYAIVEHNGENYDKYLLETVTLTNEIKTYSYEFKANVTDSQAHLVFALGKIGDVDISSRHEIYIDNVKLLIIE
jgi:beta-glucanase (GH16 family)